MQPRSYLYVFAAMILIGTPVFADTINVNLISITLSGPPGSTLTFLGTLMNSSGTTQDLNGDILALSGFNASALDDSPFLFNAPLTMASGATTAPFSFFTVAIPMNMPLGPYVGSFSVTGGATSQSSDTLGSSSFTVHVARASAPEPRGAALLMLGGFILSLIRSSSAKRRCSGG